MNTPRATAARVRPRRRFIRVAAVALALGACAAPATPAPTTPAPTSTPGSTPTAGATSAAPTTVTPSSGPSVTEPPGPTPSASGPSTVGATVTVPVYYVGTASTAVGPRLYREWRQAALLAGGRIQTAVQAMLDLRPLDPDYRSLWPAGTTVRSVTTSGAAATVDLSGYPTGLGATDEAIAVSALVYTATAAVPTVSSVRLLVQGVTPTGTRLDLTRPQTRRDPLSTLANVWILQPTQGSTVGSPVSVQVYGTGWEGNVPLKVYRGGTVVASTSVLTMMGGFALASTTITLPAGSYELRAYNDNGRDGTLQVWDTKSFTVR